jgi:ribonucleoside-diphosphate reductase beta chain
MEPLLQNAHNKYTVFPIQYPDIWEKFVQHKKAIWFVDEVDLSADLASWKTLSTDEQYFIKHVLAFFASSDGIVMENLVQRFFQDIQGAEARSFYSLQIFMENEHSVMYSRLIETYISDATEKNRLFNAIDTMPAIREKGEWAIKWIASAEDFAVRLVAFAVVEGIFFSGSFCCIYWLKERGVMPGLGKSNDFISRDEALHTDFAVMLYRNHVQGKLPQEKVHAIVSEAVTIEKRFITESLPCSLLGMNATMMAQYIEFVANRLVRQLGYEEVFPGARQPFAFMERIAMQSQTNFFETREVNYQKTVTSGALQSEEGATLKFDADF